MKNAAECDHIDIAADAKAPQPVSLVAHTPQKIELAVGIRLLLGKNRTRRTLMSGPEHHDVVEEAGHRAIHGALRLDGHDPPTLKTEEIQPPERGGILILLSNRLLEHVHLDIAGFLRELPTGHALSSKRVERIQQAHRKSARPAQP